MPISSVSTISVYRKFLLGYVKVNFILTVMRRLKFGIAQSSMMMIKILVRWKLLILHPQSPNFC